MNGFTKVILFFKVIVWLSVQQTFGNKKVIENHWGEQQSKNGSGQSGDRTLKLSVSEK